MALEIVSQTYNGEYETKLKQYQAMGILYYVVFNPLIGKKRRTRKHRQGLEVYKLISGAYQLQEGKTMVWLPEIGLGIGYEEQSSGGWLGEWLYWYNEKGDRYQSAEERYQSAEELIAQERQEKEKLAAYLRSIGINPEEIP